MREKFEEVQIRDNCNRKRKYKCQSASASASASVLLPIFGGNSFCFIKSKLSSPNILENDQFQCDFLAQCIDCQKIMSLSFMTKRKQGVCAVFGLFDDLGLLLFSINNNKKTF